MSVTIGLLCVDKPRVQLKSHQLQSVYRCLTIPGCSGGRCTKAWMWHRGESRAHWQPHLCPWENFLSCLLQETKTLEKYGVFRHWLHRVRRDNMVEGQTDWKVRTFFMFSFQEQPCPFFLPTHKVIKAWSCNQQWLNNHELLSDTWTLPINQKHKCINCETKIHFRNLPLNSLTVYFVIGAC